MGAGARRARVLTGAAVAAVAVALVAVPRAADRPGVHRMDVFDGYQETLTPALLAERADLAVLGEVVAVTDRTSTDVAALNEGRLPASVAQSPITAMAYKEATIRVERTLDGTAGATVAVPFDVELFVGKDGERHVLTAPAGHAHEHGTEFAPEVGDRVAVFLSRGTGLWEGRSLVIGGVQGVFDDGGGTLVWRKDGSRWSADALLRALAG